MKEFDQLKKRKHENIFLFFDFKIIIIFYINDNGSRVRTLYAFVTLSTYTQNTTG